MHILLVALGRADEGLARQAAASLHAAHHQVDLVHGAEDGRWLAADTGFDAIVVARPCDDAGTADLCAAVRAAGIWTPILVLAPSCDGGCVASLDAGADDCETGPLWPEEFEARLRALIRRGQPERPSMLRVGAVQLDPGARQVRAGDRSLPIVGVAFDLLELLMRRAGQVTSRQQMANHVWDWAWETRSNTLDVHIHHLRATLEPIAGAPSIDTIRGIGYRLRPPDGRPSDSRSLHGAPATMHPIGRVDAIAHDPGGDGHEALGCDPCDGGDHRLCGAGLREP